MDIKDVLVVLEADCRSQAVLDTALGLAEADHAAVHALCVIPWRPSPADCFAVGPKADLEVLDRLARQATEQVEPIRQAFLTGSVERGIKGDWAKCDEAEAPFVIPLRAQSCDIVVMRQAAAARPGGRALAERLLLDSGTPCLFVPDDAKTAGQFSRIALAWNGTPEAKRAMDDSLPLLKRASRVDLIVVGQPAAIDVGNRPMDVIDHLARHGVECAAHERKGRASHVARTLMAACKELDAELLVLGAYSHSHLAEAFFGGTTSSALVDAAVPVLMVH